MYCQPTKIVNELDQYIASTKTRLQSILTALEWTIEDSLKESTCPKEVEKEESPIDKNDPPLPETFDCDNSLVIDNIKLQSILQDRTISIPTKFSDVQLNFTRKQKCTLYEYVIANTAKTSEPELQVSFPNAGKDMTFAEIVAKEKKKDKKLQRKYRTSKPTHIEEVRNLVHLQMQALKKYFNPRRKSKSPTYRNHRRKSDESSFDSESSLRIGKRRRRSRSPDRSHRRKLYDRQSDRIRRSDKREETSKRRSRSSDRSYRSSKTTSSSIERNKSRLKKTKRRISPSQSPESKKIHRSKHHRRH